MRATIICLLISAVAISADLQSDVAFIARSLPLKEIESIGRQYVATYPNYAEGLRYVQNITYEKVIKDFLETKEGEKLVDYFSEREIDIKSIWLSLAKLTSGMIDKWLTPKKDGEESVRRTIISGDIMADYFKAITDSDFLDVVQKKMEESPEFAKLAFAFLDPQFHQFFDKIDFNGSMKKFGKKF